MTFFFQRLPEVIDIYHQYLKENSIKLSEFFQLIGLFCLFNPTIPNHLNKSVEAFIWFYLFTILEVFQLTNIATPKLPVHRNLKLKYYQLTLPNFPNEWYWMWWGEQILKQYQYQYHPILIDSIEYSQV